MSTLDVEDPETATSDAAEPAALGASDRQPSCRDLPTPVEPITLCADPYDQTAVRRRAALGAGVGVFTTALTLGALILLAIATIDARAWLPAVTLPLPVIALIHSSRLASWACRRWWVLWLIGNRLYLRFTTAWIEYDCEEGVFSVPWSAVRGLRADGHAERAGRHAPTLHLYVAALGGPLARLHETVSHVTMPICHPGELEEVGEIASQATGGRLDIPMAKWRYWSEPVSLQAAPEASRWECSVSRILLFDGPGS